MIGDPLDDVHGPESGAVFAVLAPLAGSMNMANADLIINAKSGVLETEPDQTQLSETWHPNSTSPGSWV